MGKPGYGLSLLWAGVLACGLSLPAHAEGAEEARQQGQEAFARGDYLQAIGAWQSALAQAAQSYRKIDLGMRLSAAHQAVGDYAAAYRILQEAAELGQSAGTPAQRVLLRSQAGDLLLAMQQPQAARERLEQAVAEARGLNNPAVLAHALNNLGNLHGVEQDFTRAAEAYQEAARLAPSRLQARGNLIRALAAGAAPEPALAAWRTLRAEVAALPDGREKSFWQVNLGELALLLARRFPAGGELLAPAEADLRSALAGPAPRLQAYALGYLAEIAEQRGDSEAAAQTAREAIFLSQTYPELLYRWEWLQGRLLQARGELAQAENAYRLALAHLQQVRTGLEVGQRDARERFYREVRPVYYGVADVILRQAALAGDSGEKQRLLRQARQELEQIKLAELQNYFSDPCLVVRPGQTVELDQIAPDTAVLYPVILPDRLELLLSIGGRIEQIVVAASAAEIEPTILALQQNLQNRTVWRFMNQAKALHGWLIEPIQARLAEQRIHTIVWVPDGLLRMIPLAVLHDGEKYLAERFAVATTPGLSLTDPRQLSRAGLRVLLSGLSEGVQGFSPLPEVRQEIDTLHGLFQRDSVVLLDQQFLLDNMGRNLENIPYSIVHVASHAQFERDADNTFLLAYDGKLTMNRLERMLAANLFRERPVELLTLSACQTAVGDERAALGLAGVALKAGSRSALASLWFVSDEATASLISEFYRVLQEPAASKADALRQAQLSLIARREFRHPAYWAPFLLIGNWL
jgi:CHAT domain-containing protein